MFTYIPELYRLVRSIVIKSSHQAKLINDNIIKKYGINSVTADSSTWRYYLNLNGVYHFSNEEMYINVIENGTSMKLTKELLDLYPKTKYDLMLYTNTYKELVAKYPTNELLIKCMLNPVDYSKSINSEDGEIISYSNVYLEINERGLIRELSKYCVSTYNRWFNDMYLKTSPAYLSIFLSFLYSTLPNKIDSLRFTNIHTHRVSKFHMDSFFKSNLDINTRYLNYKSKFWLYQNLRALMINTGKDETLEEIISNVLTPNGVGVGGLILKKAKPINLEESDYIYSKSNFNIDKTTQLVMEPKNSLYYSDGLTITEIINMEVDNDYINTSTYNKLNDLIERETEQIVKNSEIDNNTKVLHLVGREDRDILPFPRINMVLDNLFHIGLSSNVIFNVLYLDENTNITYNLTYDQSIRLLAYYLLKMGNMTSNILNINSNAIIKKTYTDVSSRFIKDGTNYEYVDKLLEYRPTMFETLLNTDNIVDYINDGMSYFINDWIIKSSLRNQVAYSNLMMVDAVNHKELLSIDIDNIHNEINLMETPTYDYVNAIRTLVLVLTNNRINIDLAEINYESILSYIDLVKKTTSYNVQIIGSSIVGNSLNVFDIGIDTFRANPILTVKSKYINGFETLEGDLGIKDTSLVSVVKHNNVVWMNASELTLGDGLAMVGNRTPILESTRVIMDLNDNTIYTGVKVYKEHIKVEV